MSRPPRTLLTDKHKECSMCGEIKPLSDYYKNKKYRGGVYHSCKVCIKKKYLTTPGYLKKRRQYMQQRIAEAKLEMVEFFGNKCADCNNTYPLCVYDFHHLDPVQKDMKPTKALGLTKEKRIAELRKCVLLCANCHRIRHDCRSDRADRLEEEDASHY